MAKDQVGSVMSQALGMWFPKVGVPPNQPFNENIPSNSTIELGYQQHHMGVSINGGSPHSWMVYVKENPIFKRMMARGAPI